MQRRSVKFLGGEVTLVDDETGPTEPPRRQPLQPLGSVVPEAALKAMGNLHPGDSIELLGSKGPLVASRATMDEADTESTTAFAAYFGRDSLTMASFLAPWLPDLRRSTVLYWAERQGRKTSEDNQEEPGRIAHEIRDEDDPRRPYLEAHGMRFPDYGSLDATALWCIEAVAAIEDDPALLHQPTTHVDNGSVEALSVSLKRALDLLDRWRSRNAEGLIESHAYAGLHKAIPLWKDSSDAYHHRDGQLATPPVCGVEMMGFAYDAYIGAARLADRHPTLGWDGNTFRSSAAALQASLFEYFWVQDDRGGFFALGTDRDPSSGKPRPLAVKASNMGMLLDTGILDGDEYWRFRQRTIDLLFDASLLCPAGIRTLANDEVRFGPDSYHNGSVWPHDTFRIARGVQKSDPRRAERLFDAIELSCREFLPEFMPGTDNPEPKPGEWIVRISAKNVYGETIERGNAKVPERLQGWTAAALYASRLLRQAQENSDSARPA